MREAWAAALAALIAATAACGSEYHVAPQGNDEGPGTKQAPFATIQHAADRMQAGDTCWIAAGTYRETVRPKHGGAPGKPIVFAALPGERVILSGADPVRGWRKRADGAFTAEAALDLGPENQVFFDGRMMFEARWPDKPDDDLLQSRAAPIGPGSEVTAIHCGQFPATWKEADLKGAVVWVMAQSRWSSWTSEVTGYDPEGKRLRVAKPYAGDANWWVDEQHNPARGGEFYLSGVPVLLDHPNEWLYDSGTRTLAIIPPAGREPTDASVTVKRRALAFDLRSVRDVQVKGIEITAASVDLTDAERCLLQGIRARYIAHTRGGKSVGFPGKTPGICVSGANNVVRDCEIVNSAGSGVRLAGRSNAVINCSIHHVDYLGCYEACVVMQGMEQLVSHNSLHDAGRDCVMLGGTRHQIQYNDIHEAGRLCHDTGVLYGGGADGGNTEIHHNWVHGNPGRFGVGIYLDNYMKNFIVHHNVVWDAWNCIRLNRPTGFCVVAHNTVAGNINNIWGPWQGQATQFGSHVFNNLVRDEVKMNPEVFLAHNLTNLREPVFDIEKRLPVIPAAAVDAGLRVAGINDVFQGSAPDIGAYEQGETPWKPGHDFDRPPQPEYHACRSLLRNRIVNSAFDLNSYQKDKTADPLAPWLRTHAKAATVEMHPGFNDPPADARLSVNGQSLRLTGESDDGVKQRLEGLEPNARHVFGAYVRLAEAGDVVLEVRDHGTPPVSARAASVHLGKGQNWRHVEVPFTTGAASTAATVSITKKGPGNAYVDDTGVMYWEFHADAK